MTKKPAVGNKKSTTVIANDPDDLKGMLKSVGGSQSDNWNNILGNQAIQTLWLAHSDQETQDRQYSATVAALSGIGPKDELEGMMAAQLIAAHNAAMECYRRAMISEQTLEGRRENLNQANKLSRTCSTLPALNRHRARVSRRSRSSTSMFMLARQAVVGVVETPGRDRPKSEDQPHQSKLPASQPSMRSPDADRESVQITGNAERPLSNARRNVDRRSKG
jgi:hypothetical protein